MPVGSSRVESCGIAGVTVAGVTVAGAETAGVTAAGVTAVAGGATVVGVRSWATVLGAVFGVSCMGGLETVDVLRLFVRGGDT